MFDFVFNKFKIYKNDGLYKLFISGSEKFLLIV